MAVFPKDTTVTILLGGSSSPSLLNANPCRVLTVFNTVNTWHLQFIQGGWILDVSSLGRSPKVLMIRRTMLDAFQDEWKSPKAGDRYTGIQLAMRVGTLQRLNLISSEDTLDAMYTLVSAPDFSVCHLMALEAVLRYIVHGTCDRSIVVLLRKIMAAIQSNPVPMVRRSIHDSGAQKACLNILIDTNGRLLAWALDPIAAQSQM